jgi:uncharacterized protein YkwD
MPSTDRLPPFRRYRIAAARIAGAVAAAAILQSCGGGDGDVAAAGVGAGGALSSNTATGSAVCTTPDFSAEVLQRVNARRASGTVCGARGAFPNAVALQWDDKLTAASAAHSQDMATANYFAHSSQDGRTPGDRITAAGYDWATYGENIAAGYPSVQAVVDAWFASDGHCANLMNGDFRDIGVACVASAGTSRYANYWTMELGATR